MEGREYDLLKPRNRVMEMAGVGALDDVRWWGGACTARPDDGRTLHLAVSGLVNRVYRAVDPAGGEVATYRRERVWRRDGTLTWRGMDHELVQEGTLRRTFALRRSGRDLLTLKYFAIGPRRVNVRVTGVEEVEPGLVLYCAWLVLCFGQEDATTAAST